ncbi:MAG: hypothetical protein IRZ07_26845 [Microbispora sp.]|nr:hypothetical protein [Microbispora sp.]
MRWPTPVTGAQPYDLPAPGGPGPAGPLFLPVADLDTGGAVAIEVIARDASPGVAGTVNGVPAAAREEALLPLVLPIPAAATPAAARRAVPEPWPGTPGQSQPWDWALRTASMRLRAPVFWIAADR